MIEYNNKQYYSKSDYYYDLNSDINMHLYYNGTISPFKFDLNPVACIRYAVRKVFESEDRLQVMDLHIEQILETLEIFDIKLTQEQLKEEFKLIYSQSCDRGEYFYIDTIHSTSISIAFLRRKYIY